jgi:hypothetical protein
MSATATSAAVQVAETHRIATVARSVRRRAVGIGADGRDARGQVNVRAGVDPAGIHPQPE